MTRFILIIASLWLIATAANIGSAQVVTVDQPAVCYNCHDDIQELQNKKHVHGAFASGECSNCHNPHASRHASLLNSSVQATCFQCHDEIKDQTELANVHQPVANGECLSCHDPHASDFNHVLKQSPETLCASCHENVKEWLARANVHPPVEAKECSDCHVPHGSKYTGLLKKAVPTVCFDCHDNDASFKKTHKGYDLSSADCTACHDPHSSKNRALLMANQHPPFEAGECGSCHSKSATAGGSFAISGEVDKICYGCHDDIKESSHLKYSFHLKADGSCLNCHNPHASNASTLLSSDQKNLCMKCHFTDVPSKEKSEYITHPGQDCTICHTPHGANNARYLANDNVTDLCNSCHEDAHKNSHPMGEKVIDPRNGKPMNCLSCHKMHGSGHEYYLAFDPDMDLCIQCHKK